MKNNFKVKLSGIFCCGNRGKFEEPKIKMQPTRKKKPMPTKVTEQEMPPLTREERIFSRYSSVTIPIPEQISEYDDSASEVATSVYDI